MPAAPIQPATAEPPNTGVVALPTEATQVYTMLYVEDNVANLMLVEDVMARRTDVRMLSAHDGYTGLALAKAHNPDVILMDINLPGMSGLQTLTILKSDPALKHIPVVALSANAMPHDIESGLSADFFDYLTKPVKIYELMTALDEALAFSKAPQTAV